MKKIVPHILFFLISFSIHAQGVFFNMGKNFSTITYKNRSAFTEKLDINGIGDAYEVGYTDVLKYKNFKDLKYTGSVTINDYNAIAETSLNRLEWKTTYLGVQSTVDYQFYDAFFFFLSARAGLNLSTILRGKQTVNNAAYDLVSNKEFSGLVLQPVIGVYAKYYLSKNGYLSAGLNLSKTLKLGNNTDHVSINNTQILFGGYFDLIKR
ncbi:MAG: hypothetical protein KA509_03740 [Flavobacterium sp.]|jgi:hypothetical protein|nr:hypothetical protein [Flavobacterium sp.]